MAKKQISLSPDAFKVNDQGEVVLNDQQLAEAISQFKNPDAVGQQGLQDAISVTVTVKW